MKTIKEIRSEIDDLIKEASQKPEKQIDYAKFKRRKKVISNTIKSLRFLIAYIETNPREDLVKAQLAGANVKIRIINNRFDEWCNSHPEEVKKYKNIKARYRSLNEMKKLEDQRKALNYLLR
jgi:hypothetical protein